MKPPLAGKSEGKEGIELGFWRSSVSTPRIWKSSKVCAMYVLRMDWSMI